MKTAMTTNTRLPFTDIMVWFSFRIQMRSMDDGLVTDPHTSTQCHHPVTGLLDGLMQCSLSTMALTQWCLQVLD